MTIASPVLDDIVGHARESQPQECCGVLLGRDGWIARAMRTRNRAASPARFEIDPQDHIAARRIARQDGLEVVGFYHSHPRSRAWPSETDLAEAAYPECLHLIVGFVDDVPETRLFMYRHAVATELEFFRM